MDPLGFALENFDATGRWRVNDAGSKIDASSMLDNGTKVNGPVTLRQAILSRPEMFAGTLTEKLMVYGLGRGLDYNDMPVVRKIVRDAGANDYKFSSIVLGIATSTPFQMKVKTPTAPAIRAAIN